MNVFTEVQPTLENYWRSVILFGRNVASYKFALGKSLLELADKRHEIITLQDLAEPFSRHACEHLKLADKQGSFQSSRFLDVCRKFNADEIKKEELLDATARLGFNNVIDAFHVVHDGEIGVRFFSDERQAHDYFKKHPKVQRFKLHNFRGTAMSRARSKGVSYDDASVAFGCHPETMRKHYVMLDEESISDKVMDRIQDSGDPKSGEKSGEISPPPSAQPQSDNAA